jgi:hypothetical protein
LGPLRSSLLVSKGSEFRHVGDDGQGGGHARRALDLFAALGIDGLDLDGDLFSR